MDANTPTEPRRRPLRLFLHTAGTRVLGLLSGSLLVVLLARTLDPAQYGVYALFTTTYVFGNLILGFNLSGNLSRRVPGREDDQAATLLSTFVITEMSLGGAVLILVMATGLDRVVAGTLEVGQYLNAFRLLLLVIWVDLGAGACLNYLLARKSFAAANVLTLLRASALGPGLSLFWLFRRSLTVSAISAVWLCTAVLATSFGFVATRFVRGLSRGFDWTALRGAVSFGLMLASQSFAFYFLKMADRYFLARYVNLNDVGIYSFAYTLSNIAYSLSALVLISLFQPHVVEAHNRANFALRDLLLAQMTRACLASVLLAAALTALVSRQIIFFARPAYQQSATVLPWLLLTLVPIVASYPAAILLMLEGKLWASLVGGAAAMAVAIPLNVVLIPRWSYYGSLIASIAGFSVLGIIQHSIARSWRFLGIQHLRGLTSDVRTLVRGVRGRSERPSSERASSDSSSD